MAAFVLSAGGIGDILETKTKGKSHDIRSIQGEENAAGGPGARSVDLQSGDFHDQQPVHVQVPGWRDPDRIAVRQSGETNRLSAGEDGRNAQLHPSAGQRDGTTQRSGLFAE